MNIYTVTDGTETKEIEATRAATAAYKFLSEPDCDQIVVTDENGEVEIFSAQDWVVV